MLGKNEVHHNMRDVDGKLLVNEIFYTIQGEGPDAGCPAVFVRLAKCNLRCFFCDTEFEKGVPMSAEYAAHSILTQAGSRNRCELVVITGGEPLLQNIVPLVTKLNGAQMRVSVETAGTTSYSALYHYFMVERDRTRWQRNRIIVSPKTPVIHVGAAELAYAWKYIVRVGEVSEEDGLPMGATQIGQEGVIKRIARPSRLAYHKPRVYIQPMAEGDPIKDKANQTLAAQICMKHGYRLSLQTHKIVGLP